MPDAKAMDFLRVRLGLDKEVAEQIMYVLDEMDRREKLPRHTCPRCWFEFSDEDPPHHCKEERDA